MLTSCLQESLQQEGEARNESEALDIRALCDDNNDWTGG